MLLDKLLEHILLFFYNITDSYGISIIFLSFAVTIIMLPLFWLAEKAQVKDRAKKAIMQGELTKIQDLKSKQEKYFYTKEIYKKHQYNPYSSLVGVLGLVIQIPFFFAAYIMLERFEPFSGLSFGPISDLSRPDQLFQIRNIFFNALPFLMLGSNLLSIKLYTGYSTYKEKSQLILVAFVFLALLYKTSAALVLYWTMNNIFSIGKNWLINRTSKSSDEIVFASKQETSLTYVVTRFLSKHQREVYSTIAIWSLYLLTINIIIDTNLLECFTSILAFLSVILLMDILILATLVKAYRSRDKGYRIITFFSILIALSHLSIVYGKFSSLTAYDFFKIVLGLQSIYLFGYFLFKRKELRLTENSTSYKFTYLDVLIYFIFLFPLINYQVTNMGHFEHIQSRILYFGILIILPTTIFALFYFLFRRYINKSYTFISFVAIVSTFYSVPFLTSQFTVTAESNIIHHILLLVLVTTALSIIYFKNKKTLSFASVMLCITAVATGVISSSNESQRKDTKHENTLSYEHLSSKEMQYKPDIYLLIYDAYVSEKQMDYYGINNKAQMDQLKDQGFTFYDDTYTLWMGSLGSMSRILDMDQIEHPSEQTHRDRLSNNTLDKVLSDNGYKTHYILHPYFYAGCDTFVGDYIYPEINNTSIKPILLSILVGEFKLAIELEGSDQAYQNTCIEKRKVFKENSNYPRFLYSHSFYPSHSLLAGKCLPYERSRYEERLAIANQEMTEDINTILENDNDAIIIIAGDHGAYLEGDCNYLENYKEEEVHSAELADRFGMFLAIRYPDESFRKYEQDIVLLQDIFFSVLADLFEDKELLNLRLKQSTYEVNKFIPTGAVDKGIIQYGADKGKPLYWDMNQQQLEHAVK